MSFCVIDTGLIITANHGILFFVNVYKYLTFKIKFHISYFTYNNNILLSAVGLLPGGSGYFACIQNMNVSWVPIFVTILLQHRTLPVHGKIYCQIVFYVCNVSNETRTSEKMRKFNFTPKSVLSFEIMYDINGL